MICVAHILTVGVGGGGDKPDDWLPAQEFHSLHSANPLLPTALHNEGATSFSFKCRFTVQLYAATTTITASFPHFEVFYLGVQCDIMAACCKTNVTFFDFCCFSCII